MLRCRKNQSTLTALEKDRFVAAVIALKDNGRYDEFVADHMNNMTAAHRGPAFLPWHRYYLNQFELELRNIDSSVTLPYWDWTTDNSATSSIWGSNFMGGDGRPSDGRVISGPFAFDTGNFPLVFDGPALRRRFGMSAPTLPTATSVNDALTETVYDMPPYNSGFALAGFRNTLEGWRNGPQLHNRAHVWVGGSMLLDTSPNDPVFFLHHCFIDKLWVDWQQMHPAAGYVPASGGPAGHNLTDSMEPWASLGETVRPADLLDHHALGYAYDSEGVCAVTVKFLDDRPPTLKVFDDRPPTFKFLDDRPTIKILDDRPPTIKALDDGPTLKTVDDSPTLKTVDDGPTLKTLDDGPTLKAVDDVKTQALDASSPTRAAPFVLSTPHHTMAWATTFPGSLEATIAHVDQQLQQHQAAIQQLEPREQQGALTDVEARQLQQLRQEFEALLHERRQLTGEGQG